MPIKAYEVLKAKAKIARPRKNKGLNLRVTSWNCVPGPIKRRSLRLIQRMFSQIQARD